jgi:hypothetical protein
MKTSAISVVLACENENASALVESVNQILTETYTTQVESQVKGVACNLLVPKEHDWKDRYESYDPSIQEAIDQVMEDVENGADLAECIANVGKRFNEEKSAIHVKEYFESMDSMMKEGDSVEVDSTKETGNHSQNHDAMDDENVNKRIRYEGTASDVLKVIVEVGAVVLDSDDSYIEINEAQANALKTVFESLNEENQDNMVEKLTGNRSGFISVVNFCLKAAK